MWSDHETDFDFLGFSHLAHAVENVVTRPDLLPATIGIYGDWGSGKSSLLKMVSSSLSKKDGVVVISLNGWLFEGYDDARAALMETILETLASHRTISAKGRGLAKNLFQRINWLRVAGKTAKYGIGMLTGGPAGLAVTAGSDLLELSKRVVADVKDLSPDEWQQFLKEEPEHVARQTVRKFREDFTSLLGETNITTLLVTIDDLDRCLPDTIIETLEAIKLFLFVPKTAFLIGADERLVQYAVRRRFPELPGERAEVGRDYLEKLVQFAVRVPPLSRTEVTTYIGLLFSQSAKLSTDQLQNLAAWALSPESISEGRMLDFAAVSNKIESPSSELQENLELAGRLAPVLFVGLNGNPRQCKRFLNTLLLRLSMALTRKVEIKQPILAKLMLLEYFRPESFKQLAKSQSTQEGKSCELRDAELRLVAEAKASEETTKESVSGKSRQVAGVALQTPPPASDHSTTDLAPWLNDEWIKEWLSLTPSLGEVDLRPYFYFSRDVLGPMTGAAQRLSPRAQDVLRRLMQDSEAVRTIAMSEAKNLDSADAAAIMEELAGRVRRSDDLSAENSELKRLFDWARCRKELLGQIVLIIQSLPEIKLPIWCVTQLEEVSKNSDSAIPVRNLIQKWAAESANPRLKKAAATRLQTNNKSGGK